LVRCLAQVVLAEVEEVPPEEEEVVLQVVMEVVDSESSLRSNNDEYLVP
jgi:hypothetical protein